MLDPSSSEDTGVESDPEVVKDPPKKPGTPSGHGGKPRKRATDQAPPESPPNKGEDEEKRERERIQKEEAERKIKLQIYVFVLRCIAYPFNAKQPTDMARRQQKVS